MVKAAVLLSLEHPCLSAVAGMQTKVEEQNYEVLLGWRSGYLLHIHVSAEQEVGPELHENQSLGCGEVKLCGLSNFGNSPVSSRRIPGNITLLRKSKAGLCKCAHILTHTRATSASPNC